MGVFKDIATATTLTAALTTGGNALASDNDGGVELKQFEVDAVELCLSSLGALKSRFTLAADGETASAELKDGLTVLLTSEAAELPSISENDKTDSLSSSFKEAVKTCRDVVGVGNEVATIKDIKITDPNNPAAQPIGI